MLTVPELTCPVCGPQFSPKTLRGGGTAARYGSVPCLLMAWARRVASSRR